MSTPWRFPTAATAVVLLSAGLATAPAHATTVEPSSPTTAYVSVVVDGPIAVAGDPYWMSGGLQTTTQPPSGIPDEPLQVQVMPAAETAYRTVATLTTDSGGYVSGSPFHPRYSFSYQFFFPGDATHLPSTSQEVQVPVGPRVSLWLTSRDVPRGGRVIAHGRTGPHRVGRLVSLYQGQTARGGYVPNLPTPVLLATGRVDADGRYRLVGRARWTGTRRVYVEVAGGGLNATGWSPYRWVTTH
ncbi:hypothetical protein [Nocardioides ultimimeridianus]